ncbi:MAG: hypothetical protein CEE38_15950 [Planctomycetes bacterium B3_Pla]|nr:MAG: hypothetical protein CEE38_15950 [Planctomycetes bacterium B3_Pla]
MSLRAPDLILRMYREESSPLLSLRRSPSAKLRTGSATAAISIPTPQREVYFLRSEAKQSQRRRWLFLSVTEEIATALRASQ